MSRFPRPSILGRPYFITSVTFQRKDWFAEPALAEIVVEQLEYYAAEYKFELHAYCVMPDHYHAVIDVGKEKSISQILHAIHSYTATLINRELGNPKKVKIWQGEAWDEVIRNPESYWRRIAYVLLNPYRAGIVKDPLDRFPHSNIGEWLDAEGRDFMNELIAKG